MATTEIDKKINKNFTFDHLNLQTNTDSMLQLVKEYFAICIKN